MKKLVTPGFKGSVCSFFTTLVLGLILIYSPVHAQQGCVMSCPPMDPPVEISLSSDCQDVLTYQLIGVTISNCPGEITVDIMDNGSSIGNIITSDMIGQTYMVIVEHPASGQSCMAMIRVVDKQAPIVACPADITLGCNADVDAYNGLFPEDISDCSSTTVYIDDVLESSGNCVGNIVSRYIRSYVIVDAYNNADTCEQVISLAKASLINVVFPPSLTGPTALSCFPLPDTLPSNTGYPTVDGNDIVNGSFCNLSAGYSNIVVPLCSGGYKILRSWTVVDWCINSSTSAMQIIEVLDLTPPVVTAPQDITVSSGASGCNADVLLPPATITDDCSTIWTVRMEGPFGTIQSNGGVIPALPIGVHRIIYKAISDCNTEGVDTMYITVQDLIPPAPVCHQFLAIPVNNVGVSAVPASVFNAGSTDNCGSVFVKAKRMNLPLGSDCFNPGNPTNLFDDYVQFCCEDIANNNILVILRVYDIDPGSGPVSDTHLQGHFNDCMVQVEVQDKLAPQIICPSDLTISCEFPFTEENLDVFGSVALTEQAREQICLDDPGVPGNPGLQCIGLDGLASDNCQFEVEETDPVIEINNCGAGTITRTFVATDDGGLQTTCQQVITVINYDLFDESNITWPSDYTTFDVCEISLLDPDDLAAPYNEPVLIAGACDMVAATHDDDIFDFSNADQACFKILRTWTVMDWCQLNTPTVGIWTHIQVIKVMNSVAPEIAPIADLNECSFDPECGGLTIDFEARAEDDCSGPASLTWKYFIDINNNNSFEYTSIETTGATLSFSRELPIGTHRIVYTVWDLCGNLTTEEQLVTVRSCKPPSAKCIHGLSTNLMAMDTDGDGTADWGMVTLQAEMFDAGSDHPCGNPVSVAFSADPQDVTRVFDCGDLGENEIELWAIDQQGLTDFCITTIEIQDNNSICPPQEGGTGIISGNISVPQAGTLSGAMIYLDGSTLAGMPSGGNGQFVFPAMPLGGEYVVRPVREGDARNGVTTLDLVKIQKHLLGLELFTSPFQYIAADVNNSASISAIDIIQLRKLILGFYNEFPSNKSWRFVDKAHIFPDPLNPWLSSWPETYSIIPFSASMNDVDFNAIKIGDLNLSANLQAGGGMILPRSGQSCEIEYVVSSQPDEHIYRVDIYLQNADLYNALQFSFDWDQAGFKLLDWSPGELISVEDIRMPEKPGENGSIASFTMDGWKGDKMPVLTLWVEQVASMGYPFKLFLSQKPTQPLAFTADNEAGVPVTIVAGSVASSNIQNKPNPFADMTTIQMVSDRTEPATLRIFDLSGKLIHSRNILLVDGENEYIVRRAELKGTGIYMYEIESDFQYSTNRMIIVD
jgi:hypothetical protein